VLKGSNSGSFRLCPGLRHSRELHESIHRDVLSAHFQSPTLLLLRHVFCRRLLDQYPRRHVCLLQATAIPLEPMDTPRHEGCLHGHQQLLLGERHRRDDGGRCNSLGADAHHMEVEDAEKPEIRCNGHPLAWKLVSTRRW
jgi:hypothetical protein